MNFRTKLANWQFAAAIGRLSRKPSNEQLLTIQMAVFDSTIVRKLIVGLDAISFKVRFLVITRFIIEKSLDIDLVIGVHERFLGVGIYLSIFDFRVEEVAHSCLILSKRFVLRWAIRSTSCLRQEAFLITGCFRLRAFLIPKELKICFGLLVHLDQIIRQIPGWKKINLRRP